MTDSTTLTTPEEQKEGKEHPWMMHKDIKKIVQDHEHAKHCRLTLARHWKTIRAEHERDKCPQCKGRLDEKGTCLNCGYNTHPNRAEHGKTYLAPGEKPPKGAGVKRGPKGGLFYEAEKTVNKISDTVNKELDRTPEQALDDLNTAASNYANKKADKILGKGASSLNGPELAQRIMKKLGKSKYLQFVSHLKAKKAEHSGLGQIPPDYTKKLDGQTKAAHSGVRRKKVAKHERLPMEEYAEIVAKVIKEGDYPDTEGNLHHYPEEVIERDLPTFIDKEFYIDHPDNPHGLEMGVITGAQMLNGKDGKWATLTIHVPETDFTKAFLERIESGLITDVSSVHELNYEGDNVTAIQGDSLGTVREGAVEGAHIISVKRHIRSPQTKLKELGRAYKQARSGYNG